nr:unnamed protein product [Callosobruchus analis]
MESLKCAQLNVRSLVAHFDSVKTLLLQHNFHILFITESWLNKNIPDDAVHIDHYNFVRLDRGSRGGGVRFYIRNDLKYTEISLLRFQSAIGLRIVILNNSFKEFETSLSFMYPVADSIFCLGDFNTDSSTLPGLMPKYLIDTFESFGMKQLIKQPTRITANTATLIDYILTSNEGIVSDAGTIVAGYYEQFKSDLRSIPWKNIYDLSDVDSKVNFIVYNIT